MSARRLSTSEAARFGWAVSGPAARVVAALNAARPDAARFVGGCVRDALLGVTPHDIDVATLLEPPIVAATLGAAGIGVVPTGLQHGTVTATPDGVGVEVTTLRADVATDGRRAVVAFTEDWHTDAFRRDFTINALYLSPELELFDYAGGEADLACGAVRFIGAAEARIREDYLRILRFFRFSARFAAHFDDDGLKACAAETGGIVRLSAERVGDEMRKILALPRAAFAAEAMAGAGVLAAVWPEAPDLSTLARLKAAAPASDLALAFAALWPHAPAAFDARLRLSHADAARRKRACAAEKEIDLAAPLTMQRARQYRLGADAFADGLALRAARDGVALDEDLAALAATTPPVFPAAGRDVIARGVGPGPVVADILHVVEQRWIGEGFPSAARVELFLDEEVRRRA